MEHAVAPVDDPGRSPGHRPAEPGRHLPSPPHVSSSRGLTHAQHHGQSHNDREVDRAAGSPINHGEALIRPGASTTRVHSVTHREDGVHQPKDFGLHRARADRRPISTTGGCDDRPPTGTVRTTALAQKRWGRLVLDHAARAAILSRIPLCSSPDTGADVSQRYRKPEPERGRLVPRRAA